MIRELYSNLVCKDFGEDKFSGEVKEEIMRLLECDGKEMDQLPYGKYKDNLCWIAAVAEEAGFVKGFQYAFRLFAESMRD
ncbi:hypothetical protein AALA98_16515 [Lachnospiraceae bacterium 45-W7]